MRLFLLYFVYIRAASWRTGKNTWFCFGLLASCFLELWIWKLSGKVWSLPFLSILAITCSLKLNHIHKLRPSAWPLGAFPFAGPESYHASSCSVVSDSLQPHGLQHARLPCPSLSPRVHSDSCPLGQWLPSNHLLLCRLLLHLPSIFPSIRVFFSGFYQRY